jgi:uncharacterized protein DUF6891
VDEDLMAQLDLMVRGGYLARDEIIEALAELAGDEGLERSEAELGEAVDAALAAVRAEARTWPETTDNDRLDAAFARLTAEGIIARQDFACCTTCAKAEIWDEVDDPAAWRGNVWFHRQDTEHAVAGDGLYLGFGARDDRSTLRRLFGRGGDRPATDTAGIGREVARALSDAGLPVVWDGRVERRILVDPFIWQRRPD